MARARLACHTWLTGNSDVNRVRSNLGIYFYKSDVVSWKSRNELEFILA